MVKIRTISKISGRSPDLAVILYLLEKQSVGISRMTEDKIASLTALYRIMYDLFDAGVIDSDISRRIPGRPVKLTSKGIKIANLLLEIEEILEE